jgi:Ni/Co efflux regulator RcnB
MKRILLAASAALALAGSLAAPAVAQAPQRGYSQHYDRNGPDRDDRRYDNRRDSRNGYYVGKTWHQGPPPRSAYGQRGFQLGYKAWRKGERLGYYNTRYVEVDYRARKLSAPPRGYRWVQDDRGDMILAAVVGGLIAGVIYSAAN